jgi:hypothetical protein
MLTDRGNVQDLELRLTTAREVAAMIRRIRMALDPAAGRAPGVIREPGLPGAGEAAQARIDALSVIYATWAAVRTDVRRFRETVLARARPIMAAATGMAAPPAEAAGRLEQGEVAGWVKWCYDADSPDQDGDRYVSELIAVTKAHGPERVADLYYIEGRQERVLTVPATRVLGRLADLAEKLSQEYRWRPSEATMFILSGRTPEVFVYTGSAEIRYNELSATSRVTMTLDPSLNPEDVAAIYSRLRQRFHPAPLPRNQSVRRYQLARHIGPHVQMRLDEPHSRKGPGRPPRPGPTGQATFIEPQPGYSWQGLRHVWNQQYGEHTDEGSGRTWHYDNESNFIRDAKTALEQLLFPGWAARS